MERGDIITGADIGSIAVVCDMRRDINKMPTILNGEQITDIRDYLLVYDIDTKQLERIEETRATIYNGQNNLNLNQNTMSKQNYTKKIALSMLDEGDFAKELTSYDIDYEVANMIFSKYREMIKDITDIKIIDPNSKS